jgi:hypothetical protein
MVDKTIMGTINILVWNKRNARIFEHKESALTQLLQKIKDEAGLWTMEGAKHVSNLLLHVSFTPSCAEDSGSFGPVVQICICLYIAFLSSLLFNTISSSLASSVSKKEY